MDLHDFHEVVAIHPLNMLLLECLLQALAWVDHAQECGGGCDKGRNVLGQLQSSLQAVQASGRKEPIAMSLKQHAEQRQQQCHATASRSFLCRANHVA